MLLVGIITGLVGWINQSYLERQWNWVWTVRPYMRDHVQPYVRTPEAERMLKAGNDFKECAKDKDCPVMIVIPAGDFMMGSPSTETGRSSIEGPQHKVTIAKPFAVSKFDVPSPTGTPVWRSAGAPKSATAVWGEA